MRASAWVAGRVTFGGWCSIPSSVSVELMAAAGFDWLGFDMQHSAIGGDDVLPMVQAASIKDVPVMVRVPWNDPPTIMRMLDLGAAGVIVPMVSSADEARRAAGACFYAPEGYRSYGPVRRARVSGAPLCSVMIETIEGVENVDEILDVRGVGAVFVGPSDLAISAGLGPGPFSDDPGHLERLAKIVGACRARGVVPGIFAGDAAGVARCLGQGFEMLALNSDSRHISLGASQLLEAVRQAGEVAP